IRLADFTKVAVFHKHQIWHQLIELEYPQFYFEQLSVDQKDLYARATELLALTDEASDLAQPLMEGHPHIRAEVVFAVRHEMAHTLLDITRRRTILAMHANYGLDVLPAILETLQTYCGWDVKKSQQQAAAYATYMETNCIPDYALADTRPARSLQAV
ncbi:MAG: hypothetical protein F6K42_36685, partial [Leptolyngbya sp. SIO1D8]|nr:hypothetical protein [Leptolyngbya sp. SIO1D8]